MTTEPRVTPEALQPVSLPGSLDQVREVLANPAGVHDGLGRSTAEVPLAAVHHWHATAVTDLIIGEVVARHGLCAAAHDALPAVHERSAASEPIGEDIWSAVLAPALHEVYRPACPREQVHPASPAAASLQRSRGWDPRTRPNATASSMRA